MSRVTRIAVVAVFAGALAAVVAVKARDRVPAAQTGGIARGRPRLVDLGAGKCIPCKAMAPILEELRAEYAGRLDVTVGAVTVGLGRIAGDVGRAGTYAISAVFFVFGLNLVGVLPLPSWSMPASSRQRGPVGALLLGTALGVALGPCTFAFMAPLLGLAFRAGSNDARFGGVLVALYGFGHAAAIVLAGVSVQCVQRWLSSRGGARATTTFRLGAGAAVLAGGLYFLLTAV